MDDAILHCNGRCVVAGSVGPSMADLPRHCLRKAKKNKTISNKETADSSSVDDADKSEDSAAPSLLTSVRLLSWATAQLAFLATDLAALRNGYEAYFERSGNRK